MECSIFPFYSVFSDYPDKISPFRGLAHPLDKSNKVSYFGRKVGNFPYTMGYWTGRISLILGVCNQARRLRE
jgi:hypothetical protein